MFDRLCRWAASVLPFSWRRELPSFGYLEVFVQTYASTPGSDRPGYLTYATDPGMPYMTAIKRYGGPLKAFKLVLGPTPPEHVRALFAVKAPSLQNLPTDENGELTEAAKELAALPPAPDILPVDKVTTRDVANDMLVALNFVGGGELFGISAGPAPPQESPR